MAGTPKPQDDGQHAEAEERGDGHQRRRPGESQGEAQVHQEGVLHHELAGRVVNETPPGRRCRPPERERADGTTNSAEGAWGERPRGAERSEPPCHGCYTRAMSPRETVALLRRRLHESRPEEERCTRSLLALVPLVADCLAQEFGVRRVVLFGSVARGTAREESDIDLAVEGLAPGHLFRTMARAAEVAGRPVDLVPLEDARPEVLAILAVEGQVIRDERPTRRPPAP